MRCALPPWIVFALGVSACGRLGFDQGNPDAGIGGADSAVDGSLDAASAKVECRALAPALGDAPANEFFEPGMYVDGLRLLMREPGSGVLSQASRLDVDSAFGEVGLTTVINPAVEDPAFIDASALGLDIIAMGAENAVAGGGRELVRCEAENTELECVLTQVFDENGTVIADDVDGPSLAIESGELLLAFNRGDDLYIARPSEDNLGTWAAELVPLTQDLVADDPSLTSDGQWMFFQSGEGATSDVLVARWNGTTYVDAVSLSLDIIAASPAVGIESNSQIELFVSANTRGFREPHRTTCTLPM